MGGQNYLALDFGATSGRAIVGTVWENHFQMKEIHRFPNNILNIGGHCFWNIFSLYENILEALRIVASSGIKIDSIGIDTWGVDVAFVGSDGQILGLPYSYRDPHTTGVPERFFAEKLSRGDLYSRTGIQVMNFNTLFQLMAMRIGGSSQLEAARKVLFMPDALGYMLTGKMVTEYTIATTSHFLDPKRRVIDGELLEAAGIDPGKFAPIVAPGSLLGVLKDEIADGCGLERGVKVISVAGHDTASAVAAVPAENEDFAYLSSGTWSLLGLEMSAPVLAPDAAAANITNEGGVEGTTRFLKNITGMWILENLLKSWRRCGRDYSYSEVTGMAEDAEPFRFFINPDDPSFANPADMAAAIDDYLAATGQERPDSDAGYVRCVFESLAMRYRQVLEMVSSIASRKVGTLHIIGGGSKNALLNQFASNSTGKRVVAGPSEATAIGNIFMQAYGCGRASDLKEMRAMIRSCVDTVLFTPHDTSEWDRAYLLYLRNLR